MFNFYSFYDHEKKLRSSIENKFSRNSKLNYFNGFNLKVSKIVLVLKYLKYQTILYICVSKYMIYG